MVCWIGCAARAISENRRGLAGDRLVYRLGLIKLIGSSRGRVRSGRHRRIGWYVSLAHEHPSYRDMMFEFEYSRAGLQERKIVVLNVLWVDLGYLLGGDSARPCGERTLVRVTRSDN